MVEYTAHCSCVIIDICIPKVEGEEETKSEGKESVADGIQLLSRVQELEDKLKKYEQTREELIHDNTALELKLKASQMEEGRVRQEMANLKERLLPVLRSQVSRLHTQPSG